MNKASKKRHYEVGQKLAKQMKNRELISQLRHTSKGVKRLNIKTYNWWNESLHGVARAGVATVFPQAVCMAATFSDKMIFDIAEIISTEARAKYNYSQSKGDFGIYKGLTMWSPNINIFRDPRWGRGQETYGEDPYLTGLLGTAFIKGLQGDNPDYIKTAACAKHFAVHSGPEEGRHSFNSVTTKKDMFETYLPAFKKAVKEGEVCGVMGAYNRVNGEGSCASETLITKLLRNTWGFDGYFVSDCGALNDIVENHHLASSRAKGAALALNAGCNLECGRFYRFIPISLFKKLVTRETIENSVTRLLATRSALGMFEGSPFDSIDIGENATPEHEAFAVKAAEKGIVMLQNNGTLPLKPNENKILVAGFNAENDLAFLGNYFGDPTKFVKVTEAVKEFNENTDYSKAYAYNTKENAKLQKEALEKAENADVILFCSGLDCSMEGEEAGEALASGAGGNLGKQGDRLNLELPKVQQELLDELIKLNKKIVILNFSGGCIDFRKYKNSVDAILQCWYPGAQGGKAIANILFGKVSPSGKLPVTFYNSVEDLPHFHDYSMENRTYRYFKGEVQYPFGYGLTYTDFEITRCSIDGKTITCAVKNTGSYSSDEVLQLYVTQPETDYNNPIRSLIRVNRFNLAPGEEREITFDLKDEELYSVNPDGDLIYLKGEYTLQIADGQSAVSKKLHFVNEEETALIEECPIPELF